jgi:hypothetical protein
MSAHLLTSLARNIRIFLKSNCALPSLAETRAFEKLRFKSNHPVAGGDADADRFTIMIVIKNWIDPPKPPQG